MATEEKEDKEELIPVGEGVEEEEQPKGAKPEGKDDDDIDEDDEEEVEDRRLGAGEEDEDDEDKSKRRKEERKTRRERQRAARERDKRELDFLRRRNEDLERRFSAVEQRLGQTEVSQVDARITDLNSKIKLADDVLAEAVEKGDGNAYKEAMEIRDRLVETRAQLSHYKQATGQRTRSPEGATPSPDPRLLAFASSWMRDHSWWKPNGGDEDSRKVSEIDSGLVQEGYDPTTAEYWNELTERVREALPHRFEGGSRRRKEDDDEGEERHRTPSKKNGQGNRGPTFRTGGRERPLKKNEVYISPERKQAMIEAGVWDDPELRQRYLRSYARFDSEARGQS